MMSELLAIDPGPTESAYVIVDEDTLRPLRHGKTPHEHVRAITAAHEGHTAIETVTSYGMAVGADVFETCIETGRFLQIAVTAKHAVSLIPRRNVKLHVCGAAAAKDSDMSLARVERFAPSAPNRGKGTKKAPGWFYGFRADVWQAYALAITAVETGRVWFVHGPSTSPHMRR